MPGQSDLLHQAGFDPFLFRQRSNDRGAPLFLSQAAAALPSAAAPERGADACSVVGMHLVEQSQPSLDDDLRNARHVRRRRHVRQAYAKCSLWRETPNLRCLRYGRSGHA